MKDGNRNTRLTTLYTMPEQEHKVLQYELCWVWGKEETEEYLLSVNN